jgi:hypothetical protein
MVSPENSTSTAPTGGTVWSSAGSSSTISAAPTSPYNSSNSNLLTPPGLPGTAPTTTVTPVAPGTTVSPGAATPYSSPVQSGVSPASPNTVPYSSPGTAYTQPGTVSPPTGTVSPFSPTATAPPTGTYTGPYTPPPPGMDPYASPSTAPAPLLSQDPYFNSNGMGSPMPAMTRFLQKVTIDYYWFAGNGQKELGINDFDVSATFAIPFLKNPNTPLLLTPGFGLQLWDGPVSVLSSPPDAPSAADLPAQTYDAYLNTAWQPQVTDAFGGDLSFLVGVYSDFNSIGSQSFRIKSTALGVINFSPSFKIKAGIMYLDRLRVKMLPAGGIVWTPNPDIEFNILFPNPKIRKRWMNYGNAEWWLYLAGDYGGDAWTLKRANIPESDPAVAGHIDAFEYDDIRVAAGLEFITTRNTKGWFEVGGAFDRQLHYRSLHPSTFTPNNTVYLRAGIAF